MLPEEESQDGRCQLSQEDEEDEHEKLTRKQKKKYNCLCYYNMYNKIIYKHCMSI